MVNKGLKMQRFIKSTNVEAVDAVRKAMASLQNVKRELHDYGTKLDPTRLNIHKKKLKKKGMKKLRNSMEEMAQTMKILDGILMKRAGLQKKKKKKKKKKKENVEAIRDHECCYDDQDWKGNNENTLFVKGFDTSLSRDEIKSLLRTHFHMCGEIKRVFVPFECLTGVPVGYAFVDVEDTKTALYRGGPFFGEDCKIDVMMARYRMEYSMDTMKGCDRCLINIPFCCDGDDGSEDGSDDEDDARLVEFILNDYNENKSAYYPHMSPYDPDNPA